MTANEHQAQKTPSPELKALINQSLTAIRDTVLPNDSILERPTPRWETRRCRKWLSSDCVKCFWGPPFCQGPYLYLYWKENGKLKKKYIGKADNPKDYILNKLEDFKSLIFADK
jgi:hypothetical protein